VQVAGAPGCRRARSSVAFLRVRRSASLRRFLCSWVFSAPFFFWGGPDCGRGARGRGGVQAGHPQLRELGLHSGDFGSWGGSSFTRASPRLVNQPARLGWAALALSIQGGKARAIRALNRGSIRVYQQSTRKTDLGRSRPIENGCTYTLTAFSPSWTADTSVWSTSPRTISRQIRRVAYAAQKRLERV